MNSKTKILAILLVSISFCDLNIVHASTSLFSRIMQKVEKAKDTVTSAKNKVLAVKDKAMSAKDQIMSVKDKVMTVKDLIMQGKKGGLSGLAANAKEAMSKVGEIVKDAKGAKDKVVEIAKQLKTSETKVSDKISDATDKVNKENETDKIATTTPEQAEAVKLISSENSDESEVPNAVTPEQEETVFSEEVIAKIDKLMPSKESIDQLKSISFDGMPITDEDVPYLIERLKKFASEGIKKILLSFRKTSISLNGAMQILEGLKSYPQFVSGLTFSGNALGDEGALSIASNLSNFPMLKYLFFSDMGISGDGAVAIISMINQMSKNDERTSIQLIDLSNNKIKDEYLKTLVQSWNETKDNEQMMLMLHDNPFKNTVSIDIPSNIKLVLK